MLDIKLLIDDRDVAGLHRSHLRAARPVHRQGGDARRRPAASPTSQAAVGRGRGIPGLVEDRAERAPRAAPQGGRSGLEGRAEIRDADGPETGATGRWAGFNVMLAANMLREAASMTTQITGEIIPSDKPGCAGHGACASRPASCSASRRGTRR